MKNFFVVLLIIIIGFGILVSRQPDEYTVSRSIEIKASAAKIFPHINNFKNWSEWSPWANLDPSQKTTLSGAETGVDSVMSWEGNGKVGQGSATIIESEENKLVKYRLDFVKPMQGTSDSQFVFEEKDGITNLTWSMHGHNNGLAKKAMWMLMCSRFIGKQFEQGLNNIKAVTENGA